MKKIVFTGGGTLGHILPNIVLANMLKNNYKICYIGEKNSMEEKMCDKNHIDFYKISAIKLDRYKKINNVKIPFVLPKSIIDCKKLLKELNPDLVFSKGGYVSLPVVISAKLLNIPQICHESDYTLGIVNKIAYNLGATVLTSYNCSFNKGEKVGIPLKPELFSYNLTKNNCKNNDKTNKNITEKNNKTTNLMCDNITYKKGDNLQCNNGKLSNKQYNISSNLCDNTGNNLSDSTGKNLSGNLSNKTGNKSSNNLSDKTGNKSGNINNKYESNKGDFITEYTSKNEYKKINILVTGGSQGAKFINDFIIKNIDKLPYNFTIIGGKSLDLSIKKDNLTLVDFTTEMEKYYNNCDIVISRAGATTIAEIIALNKKAILIPLPQNVSRGDQLQNAKIVECNTIKVISQNELNSSILKKAIDNLQNTTATEKEFINPSDKIIKIIEKKLNN